MGVRSFFRGLVYFVESAGATLTRRGGGASLLLGSTGNASLGQSNTASGSGAIAIGDSQDSTGDHSFALGGVFGEAEGDFSAILGGANNRSVGAFSLATGTYTRTRAHGERAHSAGSFGLGTRGTAQHGAWHARGTTTGETPLVLRLDGSTDALSGANSFIPIEGDAYYIRAKIVGIAEAADDVFITEVKWGVARFAGGTVQIGAKNVSFAVSQGGGSTFTVEPYVSGNVVSVTVTGDGGVVRWSGEFQYCLASRNTSDL